MKCAVNKVVHEGVEGRLRANAEQIGWQSSDGERVRIVEAATVKRVEWLEGRVRILCQADGGASEVLALENFQPEDYDTLWRYFNQCCGVYMKKHTRVAALAEDDFDHAARCVEDAADRVDEAAVGSVNKKAKEADLMKKVESIRDGLDLAISGDKQALSRVFAENNCERIGRLRLVVDTVQLEVYHTDPRWKHLISRAATIEAVLKELGTFRQWKPRDDDSSLARRQMVRELKRRHGGADDTDGHEPGPDGQAEQAQHAREAAQAERIAAMGPLGQLPLGGFRPPPEPPERPPPAPEPDVAGPLSAPAAPATSSTQAVDEEVSNPNAARADALDALAPSRGSMPTRRLRASGLGDSDDRSARQSHPGSLLEGWVWKRSRFLKKWRRRWLVLMPNALFTFKMRGDREATEVIEKGTVLRAYSAENEISLSKCFCVATARRNFFMVCDEEEQKRAWVSKTTQALCSS